MKNYSQKNVLWFKEINHKDINIVGGKGANLGEMYNNDIPIPNGFVVTSSAYFNFIHENSLTEKIKTIISSLNPDNPDQLLQISKELRKLIEESPMPSQIAKDIMASYKKLGSLAGLNNHPVAVRSSATAEDLPDASFAGQQDTFLNVTGEANVVKRVQKCWSSIFTPRAIFYREKKHFDHLKVGVAVPIQKMIDSEVSGIAFSINPITNNKNQIIIELIWGLGEYIVQGVVTPDQYIIDKNTWKIISHKKVSQSYQLIKAKTETKKANVPRYKVNKDKLKDSTVIKIAKIVQKIHNHYRKPQDIELAVKNNTIYIVQSRPITTIESNQKVLDKQKSIDKTPDIYGEAASPGSSSGEVIVLKSPKDINKVKNNHILVTDMTTPDFVPAMKKVKGIVTNKGGQTSHAAIVSRELGVPCVVGTKIATSKLKNGELVTIDGTNGYVWKGNLLKEKTDTKLEDKTTPTIKTATKVYCNLGEPDLAKTISKKNVDGIGLLRAEFMIADIGIHPKRIISNNSQKTYIKKLASGMKKFCQSFSPRPVIYRATDFKTNEYRHLKWGSTYEPQEPNPMLGFRGASRYINSQDVFQMEIEAIKLVRESYGYKNLWLMIPFVRSPDELDKVKKILQKNGLLRSPSFKLFMMVEIPTNVIRLDEFIDIGIDGISIGSNDLTMLILGIDRDNSEVAPYFNELDPSVLWALKKAITTANKRGITSSICGQAPSNYPELVQQLVEWGITSISVSPDAIDRTREFVLDAEKKLLSKNKK